MKLYLSLFCLFILSGIMAQDVSCKRTIDTTTTGFFITYEINCSNCGKYAQIRDTLTGPYAFDETAQKNNQYTMDGNVIKVSFSEIKAKETVIFALDLDEESTEAPDLKLSGYFHYLNDKNERKKVVIE